MIYTVTFNPAIDYVVRLDAPLEVGEVNPVSYTHLDVYKRQILHRRWIRSKR